MSARREILSAIRARAYRRASLPADYCPPAIGNTVVAFSERARLANAEVHFIDSGAETPQAIADLLRTRNLPAIVHVPPSASALPWELSHTLTLERTAPGPDDVAVAIARFGIAETGTLVYPSGADAPASWHFRAGFEIAIVSADTILSHMEDVMAQLRADGLSSTVNFVTGPSRTGDIEQTLELGAHGPKALAILVVRE